MFIGQRICCAGEVMVEMAPLGRDQLYRLDVAGDSFNAAVYLARLGCTVSYLTRLGDDPYSTEILACMRREGIDDRLIRCISGRRPGLYLIDNDNRGERQFSYWRSESPARQLFDQRLATGAWDAFYFTGITLAVCRSGLDNLITFLGELRERDCSIVFDPNYRPALWGSRAQAREHYRAVLPLCHGLLPTLEDETLLWGIEDVDRCASFYAGLGVREVIVKAPDLSVHGFAAGKQVTVAAAPVAAVDTTGAGDAFNAGYLARRLAGCGLRESIAAGQSLAATVVQHRGAIIASEHFDPQDGS